MESKDEVMFLKDKNHELKRKIETLMEEAHKLQQQNHIILNRQPDIENEVDDCHKSLEHCKQDITKLCDDEREIIAYLKSKITDLQVKQQEQEAFTKSEVDQLKSQLDGTVNVMEDHEYDDVNKQALIESQEQLDKLNEELKEQKATNENILMEDNKVKEQNKMSVARLEDMSILLERKKAENLSRQEIMENLSGETILLDNELMALKGPSAVQGKGNSLYAEVENNRQKIQAKFKLWKSKYNQLKKTVTLKSKECNNFKVENHQMTDLMQIERENVNIHNKVISILNTRIQDLEKSLNYYKKHLESLQTILVNVDKLKEVNLIVENARKELRELEEKSKEKTLEHCFDEPDQCKVIEENKCLKSQCMRSTAIINGWTSTLEKEESLILSLKQHLEGSNICSPPIDQVNQLKLTETKQKKLRFADNV